jgi:hypothetical protein
VYIEESAQDLTVTVEGEDYQAEATVDLDDDGVDDTAVVETDDGSIAFTDTDADGRADLMTQLDADGDVVAQARFDESTGEWVHVDPDSGDGAFGDGDGAFGDGEQTAGGTTMTVDTPDGEIEVGVPTHDTDSDGKADTVVVSDPDGDTMIFTDADEDGDADYATEITEDGRVTVAEHTGDGDWTVIERGHLDDDGEYRRDAQLTESGTIAEESAWSDGRPGTSEEAREVRVDPRTGGWVRG